MCGAKERYAFVSEMIEELKYAICSELFVFINKFVLHKKIISINNGFFLETGGSIA